jgi:glycosyltransferase involved in cell wall biosynthesis
MTLPAMAEDRPLLSLVMIVKNEARSLRETIASVKPFVDRYTILDTGSTDGTQALIKEAFGETPGEVAEEPFVDFATSRNRALELAGAHTVFTLMLSGDETLVNGEALRKFCEEHRNHTGAHHGAYYVRVELGTQVYDSARLARSDAGWRFVGATHEMLTKEKTPPPSVRVPDAHIHHDIAHRTQKGQRQRWQLDLRLLTEEQKKKPNDTRTQFFLAETLECLGEHKRAFEAYEKRVKMGGWQEEVYESLYRMARVSKAAQRPWPDVQQRFLDAYAHSPHRAEPLFQIAWHYYEKKSWPLTYLFAARAAKIPFPEKANLFVDADVYKTKLNDLVGTSAFYVNELDEGEAAVRRALEHMPGDARLMKNLDFYEQKKKKGAPKGDQPKQPKAEPPRATEPTVTPPETPPAETSADTGES